MKKLSALFLLSLFLLCACEKRKPDVEIPLPDAPPDIHQMQPTSPPGS